MDTFANYLLDLGNFLKRDALDVKAERSNATFADRAFLDGKLLAYNEVLSLMLCQAVAFGLDPKSIGLEDFDPDKEL
jgi:hypothetical protein